MTDDEVFLRQFEERTLPFAEWTHRAHLKVAYLYLTRMDFASAAEKVCGGIRAYNAANNRPESLTSGYHQTTTMAWLHIMAAMIAEYGPAATADAFLDGQPQLTQKKILRLFYSQERLMSLEAKMTFVTPDLAPLPVKAK